jgi:hypothetical protein
MVDISRVFLYGKRIMLNAFDTLDALGFTIEKANSERGTLIAVPKDDSSRRIRIACNGASPGSTYGVSPGRNDTTVSIIPENPDEAGRNLSLALLDEISATVKSIFNTTQSNKTAKLSEYREVLP